MHVPGRSAVLGAVALACSWCAAPPAASEEPRIRLTAYGQVDAEWPANWPDDEGDVDVPRLRGGVEAEWRRLSLEAEADAVDDGDHLKDLWVGLRLRPELRLRAGHQKVPVGAEWMTPARRLDFVQRSLAVDNLAPGRDWGVALHGRVVDRLRYHVGLFAGDGSGRTSRAAATWAGRVVLDAPHGIEVGVSASFGDVDESATPAGQDGDGHSGFGYFDRKFVSGARRRVGVEAAWSPDPLRVSVEWLGHRDERRGQAADFGDLPAVEGRGWSAGLVWRVRGPRKGAARPGTVEVGVRCERLRFDDAGPDDGYAGLGERSRNLLMSTDTAITAGASWWPVPGVRLLVNGIAERFDPGALAPEPGRRGDYVTVLARLQVGLP